MTNIKHIYSRRKDNIISKILLINSEGKAEKKIFPIFVGICDYGIIWSMMAYSLVFTLTLVSKVKVSL